MAGRGNSDIDHFLGFTGEVIVLGSQSDEVELLDEELSPDEDFEELSLDEDFEELSLDEDFEELSLDEDFEELSLLGAEVSDFRLAALPPWSFL